MANIIFTQEADRNLNEIVANVIEYTGYEVSGIKLANDILAKIDVIAYMPAAAGRIIQDNRREAFCRGYRIVYDIVGNEVYIQTIIHSRRLYPRP
ncbi:plasmid stabilization system protein [Rodentibacter caecimuris]|uniref:Plasmid stabilization system protein n=1 Tax=Rodentibacter caecimuris TaxID=1796644 RepID=A0AAJ3K339_9PAST|nr:MULTISPECIES: type II toxin-antitoxin system RelE/ParE family toxin [Rodentibacter]OOF70660.1 plasmid stabilization system protein [Rodentibacter heylii]OOF76548.1 plasmid stabilization system protein [Rodentibacter heylii]OOF78325.1 plasmid stabilization system protein [Rodentibacter heylii]THA04650.1 type II toxin-antitoxin system RelE/ParE family toxin [Rodentibacter pneumotropicus]